jgi:membrane protein
MTSLRRFIRRLSAAYQIFSKNDGPLLATAIAYYLAFSLFPLMLLLVAGLGWAFRFTEMGVDAEQRVLGAIAEQGSEALSEQVARALASVERSAGASGMVGLVMLLVTAVAMFTQIDYAFDRIWENQAEAGVNWRTRVLRLIFTRLKAVLMLTGVGAFVVVVMISSLVWQGLQSNAVSIVKLGPWIQSGVQPLIHMLLNSLAFGACYRFLPKAPVRWRAALAGGLLAAVLWEVGRQILAAYVVGEKLPTAYGLIGSFMAIMLWTYYAMIVVLFGAAYTRAVNEEADEVKLDWPDQ